MILNSLEFPEPPPTATAHVESQTDLVDLSVSWELVELDLRGSVHFPDWSIWIKWCNQIWKVEVDRLWHFGVDPINEQEWVAHPHELSPPNWQTERSAFTASKRKSRVELKEEENAEFLRLYKEGKGQAATERDEEYKSIPKFYFKVLTDL